MTDDTTSQYGLAALLARQEQLLIPGYSDAPVRDFVNDRILGVNP